MKTSLKNLTFVGMLSLQLVAGPGFAQTGSRPDPLVIQEQGSFAVGGTVLSSPGTYNNNKPTAEGQSLHGDQQPQNHSPVP